MGLKDVGQGCCAPCCHLIRFTTILRARALELVIPRKAPESLRCKVPSIQVQRISFIPSSTRCGFSACIQYTLNRLRRGGVMIQSLRYAALPCFRFTFIDSRFGACKFLVIGCHLDVTGERLARAGTKNATGLILPSLSTSI